jgi:hypothetical protein
VDDNSRNSNYSIGFVQDILRYYQSTTTPDGIKSDCNTASPSVVKAVPLSHGSVEGELEDKVIGNSQVKGSVCQNKIDSKEQLSFVLSDGQDIKSSYPNHSAKSSSVYLADEIEVAINKKYLLLK